MGFFDKLKTGLNKTKTSFDEKIMFSVTLEKLTKTF